MTFLFIWLHDRLVKSIQKKQINKKHLHLDLRNVPGCFLFMSLPKHFKSSEKKWQKFQSNSLWERPEMWQPSNLQEKFPCGQTRHWRDQPGMYDTTFQRGREWEGGEGEEGDPSHSDGQQENLWPSPQNLINHSAPTDPDCGDLCPYKHLCLQSFLKERRKKKRPHTTANLLLLLLSRSSKLPFSFFTCSST